MKRRNMNFRMPSAEVREGLYGVIRFKVSRYYATSYITKEHFTSETNHFLVRANGSKVAKDGEYIYFLSWNAARDHALSLAEREASVAVALVERIKSMESGSLLGGNA